MRSIRIATKGVLMKNYGYFLSMSVFENIYKSLNITLANKHPIQTTLKLKNLFERIINVENNLKIVH